MPASATRRRVRSGRAAASGRSDAGLSLVEAIIAIAIVAVAVAATAAALSAASKSRDASKERSLAAEIANEVLAKAETFGCGLPPDFDGVSHSDRLDRCDYNGMQTGGEALADIDYTETRDDRDFNVQVRMRWFAPGIDAEWNGRTHYTGGQHHCRKRAEWASGLDNPADNTTQDKATARQPTVLARTVTVTPAGASQRSVEIISHEAIRPPEDVSTSTNTNGIMIGPAQSNPTNKDKAVILQNKQTNPDWTYRLTPDTEDCIWFPFLTRSTYYASRTGASSATSVDLSSSTICPKSTTVSNPSEVCYRFFRLN